MKKKSLLVGIVLLLMLSACASAPTQNNMAPQAAPGYGYEYQMDDWAYDMEEPAAMPEEIGILAGQERLVIQTASLRVSVADTVEAMNRTKMLANELGGYVVSSNRYSDTSYNNVTYARTSIVIRVPSEKLEQAMETVRQLSADGKDGILSESLTGQDVTSDFVDSSSRLRNLKAAEEQLMALMENTDDLEATMSVFRELTNIRSQIEVLEGHIKYLQESSALSSLSVEFVAEASLQPIEIGGWKPSGVVRESLQRLIRTFQDVVDFLIRFSITCLPFLIPLGVGIYFLVRAIRKSTAKRRAKKAVVEQVEVVEVEKEIRE
ncbi:MAG: DUF4349 domain-containing protein [Chloroflexi bacterium]|nr:DUF4349 domain-containing protein [Chloroflexota bacterium]